MTAPRPRRPGCASLLGVERPIVQTGMGWVSGAGLTAATSAAGGFGILAAVTMTMGEMRAAIKLVKERTDRPFGVNLRADQPDLAARVAHAVAEGVRLVSFAGAPTKDAVARCHDGGVLVMPTVGARRHAEKVLDMGVDAVIAQGGEGGGHTGVVPTSLLLPAVVDAVGASIPVVGAGGFHDGRGLVAALAYGADGIAMGTRFLLTHESTVPDDVKARYLAAGVTDTVVTTAIDGAPQRVDPHRARRPPREGEPAHPAPAGAAGRAALPRSDRHPAPGPPAGGPGDAAQPGPVVEPGGTGGQRADAHAGGDGRRAGRGRHPADRPGDRGHRRAAFGGRAARPDRHGGRGDVEAARP